MAKKSTTAKITGNTLKISISSASDNQTNNSNSANVQQSSSIKRVKTIAEAQSQQAGSTKISKKPVINQKKQQSPANDQSIKLLQQINTQLKSLNSNFLKISKIGANNTQNQKTIDFSKQNIFNSNFQKGLNDSLISLIDSSNFRTKMKQMYSAALPQALYPADSSQKIQGQTQKIIESINQSFYKIDNNEKTSDPTQYLNSINDKAKIINENVQTLVDTINSEKTQRPLNQLQSKNSQEIKTVLLNQNTSNQQINNTNTTLNQSQQQIQERNSKTQQIRKNIDNVANNNSSIVNKDEKQSIETQNKNQAKKQQNIENDTEEASTDVFQKILQSNRQQTQKINETIFNINSFIQKKQQNLKQSKKQKTGFINNFLNKKRTNTTQKKDISTILQTKLSKPQQEIQKKTKPITSKIKTTLLNIGKRVSESQKTQPLRKSSVQLLRSQKTLLGNDSNTPLRNFEKNYIDLGLNESKKIHSITGPKQNSGIKALIGIQSLLASFLTFYKKSAEDAANRQLYKLRFGNDEEDKTGNLITKLSSLFSQNTPKNKQSLQVHQIKNNQNKNLDIMSLIVGLTGVVWAGFKFFGKTIKSLAITGFKKLVKIVANTSLALIKWLGTKLLSTIKILVPKLWGLVKSLGTLIGKTLLKIFGPLGSKITKLIVSSFGKITSIFSKVFGKLTGPIGNVFKSVFSKLGPLINKIFGPLTNVFSQVFGKIFSGIGKIMGPLLNKIPFIGKFFSSGGTTGNALNSATKFISSGVSKAGNFLSKVGTNAGEKIGNLLTKFSGLSGGKALVKGGGKALTKGALKAIPGIGLIASAGFATVDAIKGWKNASQITGKNDQALTSLDKIKAASASALSGLTFGLISSKSMYNGVNAVSNGINEIGKSISNKASNAWNWLTKPKQENGQTGLQKIGNIGKSLFKMTPAGFLANKLYDKFSNKDQNNKSSKAQLTPIITSSINSSQFGRLYLKNIQTDNSIMNSNEKTSKLLLNNLQMNNKRNAIVQTLTQSVQTMNHIQNEKNDTLRLKTNQKNKEKFDFERKQQEKMQVFPQIIRKGIQMYFSNILKNNGMKKINSNQTNVEQVLQQTFLTTPPLAPKK